MELLDITLTKIQRRNRAAFVSRADLPGSADLLPGDKVVLRDEDGDFYAGTVIDSIGERDEARYLLNLGIRLPEEYAMKRLGAAEDATGIQDEVQSLLDLLNEARAMMNPRPLPLQRTGA